MLPVVPVAAFCPLIQVIAPLGPGGGVRTKNTDKHTTLLL